MDGGDGTENAELNLLVGGCLPMGQVVEIDQAGAAKRRVLLCARPAEDGLEEMLTFA